MIRISSFCALTTFCTFLHTHAQSLDEVTQATEWAVINSTFNFGKRIGVVADGNFRFVGDLQSMQHMLRAGIDLQVVKNLSVVPLGYAYVWNYRYGEQPATFVNNEFRFWQQIQYKHKLRKFSLAHRVRLEQRYLQRHHISITDQEVIDDGFVNRQGRVRYRFYATLPLKKAGSMATGYPYLNVWDEVHFSWGEFVHSTQPNQNRLFAGAGYQFSKATSVQAGFLYQLLKKDNGLQAENNVGLLVQASFVLDVIK